MNNVKIIQFGCGFVPKWDICFTAPWGKPWFFCGKALYFNMDSMIFHHHISLYHESLMLNSHESFVCRNRWNPSVEAQESHLRNGMHEATKILSARNGWLGYRLGHGKKTWLQRSWRILDSNKLCIMSSILTLFVGSTPFFYEFGFKYEIYHPFIAILIGNMWF